MAVEQEVALLPCPFCGGPGDIESRPSYSQAANTYFAYRGWCDQCGFGVDWHNHERDAIAAWNTRATLSDQEALEHHLRQCIDAIRHYSRDPLEAIACDAEAVLTRTEGSHK